VVQAIGEGRRIGIVTDYDVDGICSHVVLYEALHHYFGVPASCLKSYIGHRLKDGYGISEGLTDKILADDFSPDLIISADCGSSDEERIQRLKQAGIDVVVTDHHSIPTAGIPVSAIATVNPRREDCAYPDKAIAGCMVSWLLMCYVRNLLIEKGHLPPEAPKLAASLDCVALGTVADAVSLVSPANRAVINAGLTRMNQLARPCWRAMFNLLGRTAEPFTTQDLGFQIGPRINARSRMADPYAALRFVLSEDLQTAELCLSALDHNNRERKQTEQEMLRIAREQAYSALAASRATIVAVDARFHAGVQGIVASRLVETFGRPAIIFSHASNPGHLTGSARTIEPLHIQKVLQAVAALHPDLFVAFGGHRGAAGLTIYRDRLAHFKEAFETAVQARVEPHDLGPVIWTDGSLDASRISMDTISEIEKLAPFGRGFEEPVFEGWFEITRLRRVGAESMHLSMELLSKTRQAFKAIWFRAVESADTPLPVKTGETVRCAYRLNKNRFRGKVYLQLIVLYACPAEKAR
jgi:single-stranded-DNA-specific exonuclease